MMKKEMFLVVVNVDFLFGFKKLVFVMGWKVKEILVLKGGFY